MKLGIYAQVDTTFPMILAPECMRPSLDSEHRYGPLRLVGTICLEDAVVSAIGHDVSPTTGNLEYVVTSDTARTAVEALMERAQEA